jgi:uncharacterized protein YjbI with pentapeptide repeats
MTHRRGLLAAALAGGVVFHALATVSPASAASPSCQPGSGPNLAGQTLTEAQVDSTDLKCATLTGAHLDNLNLDQQDFGGADLTGASLNGAKLVQASFANATLSSASLSGADLTQADLGGATMKATQASGAKFGQATMKGAVLTGLKASGADFSQVDLTGLSVSGADLSKADLTQANLTDADLSGANLTDATVTQTTFTRTNLTGANLSGVDLGSAIDTSGAKLTGATGTGGSSGNSVADASQALLAPPPGPLPVDAFAAIMTWLLALSALGRRLRAGATGRVGAWLVVLAATALAVAEIVGVATGPGWQANLTGILFFIIAAIPSFLIFGLISAAIRRTKGGWSAVFLSVLGLAGYFTLLASSLALIADGLYPSQNLDDCTAASCAGGIVRGPVSLGIAIVLIILVLALGGRRRPAIPNVPQAAGQQSAQQYQAQLQASAAPQLQAGPWTQAGAPVQVQPAAQVRPSQAPTQAPVTTQAPVPTGTLPPGQPAQGTVILNGKPVSTNAPQKPPRWGGR